MPAARIVEELPALLSFSDGEALASRMDAVEGLTLGLKQFRRTRLFGEGALLGLLMLARLKRKEIRIELGNVLPPFRAGGTNRLWKIFTESAAGFVLGQLADAVHDSTGRNVSSEIRSKQSVILKAEEGYIGSGKEIAAVIADRYGAPTSAALLNETNATSFTHLLAFALAARLGVHGEPSGAFSDVAMFASELLENTRDHATTNLDEVPIEGVRFLNVRRINPDQEDVTDLCPERDDVGSYADALGILLKHSRSAEHLVEMTVADSGPGIAARMSGNAAIYTGEIADERRVILRAMDKGGSSKPTSVTGRGLGFQNALDATRKLGGLFVLRTGRTRLFYPQYDADPKICGGGDPELPFVAGTSVSLFFPWKLGALQLTLFGGADENRGR